MQTAASPTYDFYSEILILFKKIDRFYILTQISFRNSENTALKRDPRHDHNAIYTLRRSLDL